MKRRYFRTIQIDKKILRDFLSEHRELSSFVHLGDPFYTRVSRKPYPGLIHTILGEGENSNELIAKWNQLNDFAKKIKPIQVNNLSPDVLIAIAGKEKAKLIQQISADVIRETLDLDALAKESEEQIIYTLQRYTNLSMNTIKTFALFSCFKQNILCSEDPDFIKGLKIFLNKENITQEDINKIKIEYEGQLTLFSLCMWKIKNERSK